MAERTDTEPAPPPDEANTMRCPACSKCELCGGVGFVTDVDLLASHFHKDDE